MRAGRRLAGLLLIALIGACGGGGAEATGPSLVTDTGDAHPEVRATLERECVVAGGEQALTASVGSGVAVQYSSTYADGDSGREPPHGGGHGGVGQAVPTDGVVEASWDVSEDAPPGVVVVYVNTLLRGHARLGGPDEALTRLMLSYWLVGPDEECPPEGEVEPDGPPPVTTDTGDEHPRVRASVAHECVETGEEQTMTVRAETGSFVSFVSVYANGENGQPRPNGGGYGGTGQSALTGGEAELRWTIEEDAPPGMVRVLVETSLPDEDPVPLGLAFRLVRPGGECP